MTVVAIDGPVGSGKSAVARRVAGRLGYLYLDTGAMYRAVGLLATEAGVELDDEAAVVPVAAAAELRFDGDGRLFAGDRDVSGLIRSLEMGAAASVVSVLPGVRRLLVERQRTLGAGADIVMEGRDIGTNVFPGAAVKVYLTARPDVRAARRAAELREKGDEVDDEQVLVALLDRDRR
ncbi:MAG TPA: (d)CMP kinase, partial [Thermoleophilia bacterium]